MLVLLTYRRLLGIDADVAPASQIALIERVALFTPLSLVAKERIASHLVEVDVAAGDVVIRMGDAGDRFYIVGDGELDDRHRRTQHRRRARRLLRRDRPAPGRAANGRLCAPTPAPGCTRSSATTSWPS